MITHDRVVDKLITAHEGVLAEEQKTRDQAQDIADEKTAKNAKFWADLDRSDDPYDNLEDFA